jgi:hypothetical protein
MLAYSLGSPAAGESRRENLVSELVLDPKVDRVADAYVQASG